MADSKPKSYKCGAPWHFRGRALYQIHLVKAEAAKQYIPPELRLVQAFGYTLGGFYLAHYDDSPVGRFDELVVIAGIVWSPPTSCAWAARVLVNNIEACKHGRTEVGLPSYCAKFSPTVKQCKSRFRLPFYDGSRKTQERHGVEISQMDDTSADTSAEKPLCHISLPYNLMESSGNKGPFITLSLPSFSGKIEEQPSLLKYSCELKCSVRLCEPAVISECCCWSDEEEEEEESNTSPIVDILTAKPIFALSFDKMKMEVKAPTSVIISNYSK